MMSNLICPECGAENPSSAQRCRECDALLPHHPGEEIPNDIGFNEDALDEGVLDEGVLDEGVLDEGVLDEGVLDEGAFGEETFDLFSQDDHDLPDLLNALRQEGDEASGNQDKEDESLSELAESLSTAEEGESEEDVPDWLRRIRHRANEEADSVGEITQKITAAKETLSDDKRTSRHESFASWIEGLRPVEKKEVIDAITEEEKSPDEGGETSWERPSWLDRIRKAQEVESTLSEETRDGDSLLQWLVALEDGTIPSKTDFEEERGDTAAPDEMTQEIPVSEGLKEKGDTQEIPISEQEKLAVPLLVISRDEQLQAEQLIETIAEESTLRPQYKPKRAPAAWAIRWVGFVLLIMSLSFSLFNQRAIERSPAVVQPQNQAIFDWAEGFPADASLLIVFDYQAGYSDEINLVARPILNLAIKPGSEVSILSTTPSGKLLASRLLGTLDASKDISLVDLGYFPVAVYGAYGLAAPSPSQWQIKDAPQMDSLFSGGDVDGVLVLADSFEGVLIWVEQFSARMPGTPLNCLITAQAGPLLIPYWESGQVTGMVSGLSEAKEIEALLGEETEIAFRWRAYRVGILLLIMMIVLGLVFTEDRRKADEGQDLR